jgi:hypothetical protein
MAAGNKAAAVSDMERNKPDVMSFYDLIFNQRRPRKAIEQYAGDHYSAIRV